ncbi:sulfur carrier protein ThiS [Rubinisphaera sp.]|uniref:sulfur carrier protein ThiS n=1 Tax=Rubinisphaera sp. TaxID=2024857 RepID=UPI0025E81490|nr:sulfur carrier protein ThiS [Rubinisphaera sp.]|tara:strand:+ start:692 stop:901 length:210 start_codon:yes stop_codon:yes gene_type:complete
MSTISITLNGNETSIPENTSISDLLAQRSLDSRYLAVERNRELVPRRRHSECRIQPGDEIEIVTLVGGG